MSSRPVLCRDLDQARGFREIQGRVTNLGQEQSLDDRILPEVVKNKLPFVVTRRPADECFLLRLRYFPQGIHIIREDDDFVTDEEEEEKPKIKAKAKAEPGGRKSRLLSMLDALDGAVNPPVMLISLKAGALGLNLTVANNVYL